MEWYKISEQEMVPVLWLAVKVDEYPRFTGYLALKLDWKQNLEFESITCLRATEESKKGNKKVTLITQENFNNPELESEVLMCDFADLTHWRCAEEKEMDFIYKFIHEALG